MNFSLLPKLYTQLVFRQAKQKSTHKKGSEVWHQSIQLLVFDLQLNIKSFWFWTHDQREPDTSKTSVWLATCMLLYLQPLWRLFAIVRLFTGVEGGLNWVVGWLILQPVYSEGQPTVHWLETTFFEASMQTFKFTERSAWRVLTLILCLASWITVLLLYLLLQCNIFYAHLYMCI